MERPTAEGMAKRSFCRSNVVDPGAGSPAVG